MAYGRPAKWRRSGFGRKLVGARLRLGLTQAEVAARVGVSQQAYAGWERRTVAINPDHIAKLAGALQVDAGELVGGKPASKPAEGLTGRAAKVLSKLTSLPKREQDRIIKVVEDLILASRRRR
jgi:transcriptional regulator with XRE-family HTH domain